MGNAFDALRKTASAKTRDEKNNGIEDGKESRIISVDYQVPFWRRWLARNINSSPEVGTTDVNRRRICLLAPDSYVAEQFRSLRARIDALSLQRPIKTLAFTSALSGEGKSLIAVNFALVSAMNTEKRTLIVDCDFRRPTVAKALGLQPKLGLGEILLEKSAFDDAVIRMEDSHLEVLPIGMQPTNPSELLASMKMKQLVQDVSNRYDMVVFDVPATLPLPDSKTVSEYTDGLVMVVRADSTLREDVLSAIDVLDRRKMIGLILNGVHQNRSRYYYGYYY